VDWNTRCVSVCDATLALDQAGEGIYEYIELRGSAFAHSSASYEYRLALGLFGCFRMHRSKIRRAEWIYVLLYYICV
jgi:hypothetical protein